MTIPYSSKNPEILRALFDVGGIQAEPAPILDEVPPALGDLSWDRIEGMLLGLAIGDSLGGPTEGMTPAARRATHGTITDYLSTRHSDGRAVGLPSVDSQLAFWTLEQMIADGRFDPSNVADRFCSQRLFGIGDTVRKFIRNHKDLKKPWHKSGPPSAGNGAVMRIAPIVVPHVRSPEGLLIDAALCGMITHNDGASISSCVALTGMLWQLLGMSDAPDTDWWWQSFVEAARPVELPDPYRPQGGHYMSLRGTLSQYVEEVVPAAIRRDMNTFDACDRWLSGAYLLETMPSVLYILTRHGHDFEEAVTRAVNDTWDNDTVAAIVGALAGALHGKDAIPERWIDGLLGRTAEDDDGRVFELIDEAKAAFFEPR